MKVKITREYIKSLEEKGEGRINWDKWDEIVEQGRKLISTLPKIKPNRCHGKKVFGYNSNGDLVKVWDKKIDCANELNVCDAVVCHYSAKNKVVKEILLSSEELTTDVAFACYRYAIEHGLVLGWNGRSGKPLYQYNEDGKLVAVWQKVKDWAAANGYSSGTSYGGTFSEADRLYNGRLTSFNLYDEETAKEIFKEAKSIITKKRKTYKNS